jgi:hypothetical protein
LVMVCGWVEEVLAATAHHFIVVRIKIIGCKIGRPRAPANNISIKTLSLLWEKSWFCSVILFSSW